MSHRMIEIKIYAAGNRTEELVDTLANLTQALSVYITRGFWCAVEEDAVTIVIATVHWNLSWIRGEVARWRERSGEGSALITVTELAEASEV